MREHGFKDSIHSDSHHYWMPFSTDEVGITLSYPVIIAKTRETGEDSGRVESVSVSERTYSDDWHDYIDTTFIFHSTSPETRRTVKGVLARKSFWRIGFRDKFTFIRLESLKNLISFDDKSVVKMTFKLGQIPLESGRSVNKSSFESGHPLQY